MIKVCSETWQQSKNVWVTSSSCKFTTPMILFIFFLTLWKHPSVANTYRRFFFSIAMLLCLHEGWNDDKTGGHLYHAYPYGEVWFVSKADLTNFFEFLFSTKWNALTTTGCHFTTRYLPPICWVLTFVSVRGECFSQTAFLTNLRRPVVFIGRANEDTVSQMSSSDVPTCCQAWH